MPSSITVRWATVDDVDDCVRIVAGLTDFFSDEEPPAVRRDLGRHDGWVITDADAVVGFLVVERRSSTVAEIRWAGVASRQSMEVAHRPRTT